LATRAVSVSDQLNVLLAVTFQADSVIFTMPVCDTGCKVSYRKIFRIFVKFIPVLTGAGCVE